MLNTLEYTDETGHTTITWDPDDKDEVDRARAEFDKLKEAGFLLYVVDEVTEFDAGAGKVLVELISAPAIVPAGSPEPDTKVAPRRGTRRQGTVTAKFDPKAKRTVASRRASGG